MIEVGMGMQSFWLLTKDQLLALCLYGEARGESREGKIAVAGTVKERVIRGGWYGHGWHGVILKPYQFSCFNCSDPNFAKLYEIANDFDRYLQRKKSLQECLEIARGVLDGSINIPFVSTHYKTNGCKAAWADKMDKVATIENHSFYIEIEK